MLKVPKLDDTSYSKLVQYARNRIPLYEDSGWTDLNDHDPGITTLQTFAWLADVLNYYIDATGEQHYLKYLRLLGLEPARSASKGWLSLSAPAGTMLHIARGARFSVKEGSMIFESLETCKGQANHMTALWQETDQGLWRDLTALAGEDGQYAPLFAQGAYVYLGFESPLGNQVKFFADAWENTGARNPFPLEGFSMAPLVWEYNNGSGWREVRTVADDTCGFLRGGVIALCWDEEAKSCSVADKNAFYLRVKPLDAGQYDVLPRIGRVYINCVPVTQTETYAQTLELVYNGGRETALDYYIHKTDELCVAVEEGEGYREWFLGSVNSGAPNLCQVTSSTPSDCVIRFDKQEPEKGKKIIVIITDQEQRDKLWIRNEQMDNKSFGFARERMALDLPNVLELRLALRREDENSRPFLTLWDECESLLEKSYNDNVFEFNRERGEIIFGDGIAGRQVPPGMSVVAVTAKISQLGDGNIRAGQEMRKPVGSDIDLKAENIKETVGGQYAKNAKALEEDIESKILGTSRAVTVEDYAAVIKSAPGLIIDLVNIISGGEYKSYYPDVKVGTVFAAVKPRASVRSPEFPVLSELYRQKIREHIEDFRLLTADIRILPAKYARITVNGRVILRSDAVANREAVEDALRRYIDFRETRMFGTDVTGERLIPILETLPCVVRVMNLSFSCIGDGGRMDGRGNVIVFPDGLASLITTNISYH